MFSDIAYKTQSVLTPLGFVQSGETFNVDDLPSPSNRIFCIVSDGVEPNDLFGEVRTNFFPHTLFKVNVIYEVPLNKTEYYESAVTLNEYLVATVADRRSGLKQRAEWNT